MPRLFYYRDGITEESCSYMCLLIKSAVNAQDVIRCSNECCKTDLCNDYSPHFSHTTVPTANPRTIRHPTSIAFSSKLESSKPISDVVTSFPYLEETTGKVNTSKTVPVKSKAIDLSGRTVLIIAIGQLTLLQLAIYAVVFM